MVAGTDGTDYSHRERVASQYSVSATNKARLRFLVVLHLLLGVLHNVRLAPFLLAVFGLSFPALPLLSSLPPPLSTEYLWLASLPFTFSSFLGHWPTTALDSLFNPILFISSSRCFSL